MTQKELAVLSWIEENFVLSEVVLEDCNLFPYCKRLRDKQGSEMLIYFDLLTDQVKYIFPDKERALITSC
jgi:hypothetical protein